ncbi:hypothetical protein, partial [Bacillus cereus group sp. BC60]|uniref:hypothetical protein n=1 Tax=Bacillus cereus group sp. BC60 TaxID=3445283 RepID=UPI003F227101
DLLLEAFYLREGDQDPALLERIRGAWSQVRKGRVGKRNCVAKPLYTQWVKERVKTIKLPFVVICPPKPPTPKPSATIPNKEVEELKAKIQELQNKNGDLELKHLQALGEVTRTKRDRDEVTNSLLVCQKRLKISEGKRDWIGG